MTSAPGPSSQLASGLDRLLDGFVELSRWPSLVPDPPADVGPPAPTVSGGPFGTAARIEVVVADLARLSAECRHWHGRLADSAEQLRDTVVRTWMAAPARPGLQATARLSWLLLGAVAEDAATGARLATVAGRLDLAARRYTLVEELIRSRQESIDWMIRAGAGRLAEAYPDRPAVRGRPHPLSPPATPAGSTRVIEGLVGLLEVVEANGGPPPAGRVDVWPLARPGADSDAASTAYLVALPGTSSWAPPWTAGRHPDIRNVEANLELMAGWNTAELTALPQALAEAGVPAGASLVLVGHSQGGLTELAAAADRRMRERYRITHVVTAGSPVGGMVVPDSVRVLNLEHRRDVVPTLDGHANPDRAGQLTVRFGSTTGFDPLRAHAVSGYRAGAAWVDQSSDPGLRQFRESLPESGSGPRRPGVRVVLELPVGANARSEPAARCAR